MRVLFALLLVAGTGIAQWVNFPVKGIPRLPDGKPDLAAPVPKAADGKPDLSGTWNVDFSRVDAPRSNAAGFQGLAGGLADKAPFRPEAAAVSRKFRDEGYKDAVEARCIPWAAPFAGGPAPWKIVQTPTLVAILYEDFNHFRQVFLDGRGFPKNMNPTWLGYSIGHWDGDTLVVETTGYNGKIDLPGGAPSTEALKTTERYRRRDFGHLERQITIEDPTVFTKPWVYSLDAVLTPDNEIIENLCIENEKDVPHMIGK
jgi:hypothetical protein